MSDPARVFAAASLLFGAMLIALTPPFQTPDEPAHLFRAWSIAEGRMFGSGGAPIPRSIVDAARAGLARPTFAQTPLRPDDRVFVPAVADSWRQPLAYTAPSYTPLGYAVTAPAVFLGRSLGLSPVALVYLGRIANLLVSTLILSFAVRRAPFGRWALALLCLTPMAVFMRASLSVDALTIACAVALIVEILRAGAAGAIVFSLVVAALKPGYGLLPLAALGVPKLRAKRAVVVMIVVAVVAGTAAQLVWMREAGGPAASIPLRFDGLADMPRELAKVAGLLTVELVADFGWLDADAPLTFALIWIAALIGVAIFDGPSSGFSRAWFFALFVMGFVAITALFHLTAPGPEFFQGLQGRYYLPYLPLALLPLCVQRATERAKRLNVVGLTALAMAQSAWTLVQRFWI